MFFAGTQPKDNKRQIRYHQKEFPKDNIFAGLPNIARSHEAKLAWLAS